jgi:hypothetical protein
MARYFVSSGDRIGHGSAAGIDNITASGKIAAWWVWLLLGATGANKHVFTMFGSAGNQGWAIKVHNLAGEGQVYLDVKRATTDLQYSSVAGVVPLLRWKFIGVYFDDAATPKVKIFHGGAAAADTVAEVSSYAVTTDGTGAVSSDAGAEMLVGNIEIATTLPFNGLIQRGGALNPASTPDATYFEGIRAATLPGASVPTTAALLAEQTHLFAFDYQDADLTDITGNGHDGTATGTVISELLTPLDLPSGGLLANSGMTGGMRG